MCVKAKNMKEPWCLISSFGDKNAGNSRLAAAAAPPAAFAGDFVEGLEQVDKNYRVLPAGFPRLQERR